MTQAMNIRWFHECDATSSSEVGGKCASLGELIAAGLAVPPGFAVTTAAHDLFLTTHDLRRREARLLEGLDYDDVAAVVTASDALRELVEASEPPEHLVAAIVRAYGELSAEGGVSVPVAVRSSAVSEDLAGASFAGQLETYLWVQGPAAVVEHVRRCWSGFFTPEALVYRHQHGIGPGEVLMSVGVQLMVPARSAGVMFTLNPLNGDRSKVVIESTWGLGEPLVSGTVDPDRFMVDKVTLEVLERTIADKQIEHRPEPARREVIVADVAEERRRAPSLSDHEALELARLGKTVERHYGGPQDVEWAIDGNDGSILVLQARPETVWSRRERPSVVEKKGSALDYVLADLLGR